MVRFIWISAAHQLEKVHIFAVWHTSTELERMTLHRRVLVLLVLLLLASGVNCTLSKRDKKDKKSKNKVVLTLHVTRSLTVFSTIKDKLEELPTESVEDRELVTSSPKWKEIVSNHNLYSSSLQQTRNMMDGAMVLGYVTPVRDINSHHALQQSYSSCFCCLSLHMLLVCILESYPTNSLFILVDFTILAVEQSWL